MKVRGQRECSECGTRWSYYDTGSVECPDCGSLRSVGVDSERRLHTDRPADFDLTPARDLADSRPLREVADRAGEVAREYVRRRGFVRGGDLLPLDDTYLAAQELRHAADVVGRGLALDDGEEWYFLALLRSGDAAASDEGGDAARFDEDDGTDLRPDASEVPESMHFVRGLAAADAVGEYRKELADWIDDRERDGIGDSPAGADDAARDVLETLGDHVKRVRALDGDVDPETADLLVEAARDVSTHLRSDGEAQNDSGASGGEPRASADALASAREKLDRLA